jgi:hypothetical protein
LQYHLVLPFEIQKSITVVDSIDEIVVQFPLPAEDLHHNSVHTFIWATVAAAAAAASAAAAAAVAVAAAAAAAMA